MMERSAFASVPAQSEEQAKHELEPTAALIYRRFGPLIVGEGTDDVADAVFAQLQKTGKTLATAESCTGGLIAHLITAIAGVSPYYLGGVVSYANHAKIDLLGVPSTLIDTHGGSVRRPPRRWPKACECALRRYRVVVDGNCRSGGRLRR